MMHRTALAGMAVATAAGVAVAVPPPLNLSPTTPDVASGFISIDYNATTHVFAANGFTQNVNLPPSQSAGQRQFQLTALIDNSGNILPGGASFTVRGDIGGTNVLLYSSTSLAATSFFGVGAVDRFEFVFVQQSGSLAAPGQRIGTILSGNFGSFPGNIPSFAANFSNHVGAAPGSGAADSFPVPAPAALSLVGFGALMTARRRR